MKKNLFKISSAILILSLTLLAGCSSGETGQTEPESTPAQTETGSPAAETESPAETAAEEKSAASRDGQLDPDQPLNAMYLTDKIGSCLFVGTENGVLFTAPIPEELYDADGEKIDASQLSAGSLVDIYGNNIMLESHPGQYPGVTKMVVTQEGTPEDTAPYQHLIDEIYTEPDPSQLPYMNLEYTTDQAIVAVMLTSGNYTWSYTDENGQTQSLTGCGEHVLTWDNLAEVSLPGPTDLKILADGLQSVTVTRWPDSMRNQEDYGAGETVETESREDGYWIPQAEAGYVYLIQGVWEQGEIEFGFWTR